MSDEVYTNKHGGKQSKLPTMFTAIPPKALLETAGVFCRGAAKYGLDNWKNIPVEEHLDHLLNHAYLHLAGDTSETHLANVACRALMALEMFLAGKTRATMGVGVDVSQGQDTTVAHTPCDAFIVEEGMDIETIREKMRERLYGKPYEPLNKSIQDQLEGARERCIKRPPLVLEPTLDQNLEEYMALRGEG